MCRERFFLYMTLWHIEHFPICENQNSKNTNILMSRFYVKYRHSACRFHMENMDANKKHSDLIGIQALTDKSTTKRIKQKSEYTNENSNLLICSFVVTFFNAFGFIEYIHVYQICTRAKLHIQTEKKTNKKSHSQQELSTRLFFHCKLYKRRRKNIRLLKNVDFESVFDTN